MLQFEHITQDKLSLAHFAQRDVVLPVVLPEPILHQAEILGKILPGFLMLVAQGQTVPQVQADSDIG